MVVGWEEKVWEEAGLVAAGSAAKLREAAEKTVGFSPSVEKAKAVAG